MNSENFSPKPTTTQWNFGSALVVASSLFIKLLIRKQNNSIHNLFICASLYETLARKANVMILFPFGR